tara:strand:- start:213162 stop:213719 length:558 start_codon:yes stop_codon:yes gene_type:complete
MALHLLTGPAGEPVSLAEARAYLRLDNETEDMLLGVLITSARMVLEADTRRAFMTQSWKLILDSWPVTKVALPLAPASAVTEITLDDDAVTVAPATYDVALAGDAPCVMPRTTWPQPVNRVGGIAISFTAGYGGAGDVPAPLKQAILLLVAHWFDNRAPVALGESVHELPISVAALVAPYRRVRL